MVKQTGQMVVTERMTLDNAIKANLHTFDDRDDVAGFIEASFADGLFADIAAAFEEICDAEDIAQASAMVGRHAVLYPLKFGSCMREVNLWGCPYRLKCQSAASCEHFTLTGRIDELPNLIAKNLRLLKQIGADSLFDEMRQIPFPTATLGSNEHAHGLIHFRRNRHIPADSSHDFSPQ